MTTATYDARPISWRPKRRRPSSTMWPLRVRHYTTSFFRPNSVSDTQHDGKWVIAVGSAVMFQVQMTEMMECLLVAPSRVQLSVNEDNGWPQCWSRVVDHKKNRVLERLNSLRRRADVRAQAVVPLCPTFKYSTIHLQYKIKFLIQRFTTTSSSVQLCCEIINNILVVPMLI